APVRAPGGDDVPVPGPGDSPEALSGQPSERLPRAEGRGERPRPGAGSRAQPRVGRLRDRGRHGGPPRTLAGPRTSTRRRTGLTTRTASRYVRRACRPSWTTTGSSGPPPG